MNRESDNDPNCIEITSPENFKTEIDKLRSQSIKSQEPIIKKIGIPGHAFDMAFIKGKYFCFDNGALKNFTQFKDYYDRIKEDEYGIFDLENKLTFKDVEGREITINLKKKDIVCRNSTTGIFQKLQELATTQPQIQSISDLVMAISEYCRGSSGEQTNLVRVNSFVQVSSGESEHCCQ